MAREQKTLDSRGFWGHLQCRNAPTTNLAPPHFHVRYGSQRALVAIESLTVLEGGLSPRALGLVMEWASSHQDDLMEDWTLARAQAPLNAIEPLR